MVLNAYMLLIIYARVGLTQLYIACLSCLLNVEEAIHQFKLKLESSTGIYTNCPKKGTNRDPLVLIVWFLLHIGKD